MIMNLEHCVGCGKPATTCYVINGSGGFRMQTLARMGVDMETALAMAAEHPSGATKTIYCSSCAQSRGLPEPVSEVDINLHGEMDPDAPVKLMIFSEYGNHDLKPMTGLEALKARNEPMRMKGIQKDMSRFLDRLTRRGYLAELSHSGLIKITRDGKFITSLSSTPSNPGRALQNAESLIRRWERENLQPAEDLAKLMTQPPAPNAADPQPKISPVLDTEDLVALNELKTDLEAEERERRTRRMRSMGEKAALVARWDTASTAARQEMMTKENFRHRDVIRWREQLIAEGWDLSKQPVPVPEQEIPVEVLADRAERARRFSKNEEIIVPAAVKTGPADDSMNDGEIRQLTTLMTRKREISARLEKIDEEKTQLIRLLEEEREQLAAELAQITDELLMVIS